MIKTYFIADTHFNHENILKYEPYYRPFKTIEEHDKELIKRWNSIVAPNDNVFHLGDVALGGKEKLEIVAHLNGRKKLIMGNHDSYTTQEYLKYFEKCYGCLKFNGFIWLSHIPIHPQQIISNRVRYNIHGHLHSKTLNDPRYINVSCEQINLTPISWDELKKKII